MYDGGGVFCKRSENKALGSVSRSRGKVWLMPSVFSTVIEMRRVVRLTIFLSADTASGAYRVGCAPNLESGLIFRPKGGGNAKPLQNNWLSAQLPTLPSLSLEERVSSTKW